MSDEFDPYYKWLGIPPEEQPADYYRLLGLRCFENNADVIENAADQRMSHVRSMQSGKYSLHSQRILNELSTARGCLQNEGKKAAYDQQLRAFYAQQASASTIQHMLSQPASVLDDAEELKAAASGINLPGLLRHRPRWLLPAAVAGGSLAALVVIAVVMINNQRGDNPVAVALNEAAGDAELRRSITPPVDDGSQAPAHVVVEHHPPASNNPVVAAPPKDPVPNDVPIDAPPDDGPPGEGFALRFGDWETRFQVEGSQAMVDVYGSFTIETWFRLAATEKGAWLFGNLDFGADGKELLGWQVTWDGSLLGFGGRDLIGVQATDLNDGQWHHFAVCGDGSQVRFFLDGKKGTASYAPDEFRLQPSPSNIYLGGTPQMQPDDRFLLDGDLALFRISGVCRYQSTFQPLKRLGPDNDTVALYTFSRGEGNQLTDWSGKGHNGRGVGSSRWVTTDVPAASSSPTPVPPPSGPYAFVDLQPYANQRLDQPVVNSGNDLSALSTGTQQLDEVVFRIGPAMLHLGSKDYSGPGQITGIRVGMQFRKMHILHASQGGGKGVTLQQDGTLIGSYVIHYQDGSNATIPIVYGEDVRDWWVWESKPLTRGQIVWTGGNRLADGHGVSLALYLTTWQNPQPDKVVSVVDFVSNSEVVSPFCVAMTAEIAGRVAATADDEPGAVKKGTPPDVLLVERAHEEIRSVFAQEFTAAQQPGEKVGLAKRLAGLAAEEQRPDSKYALWEVAMELAAEATAADVTLHYAVKLAEQFTINGWERQLAALELVEQHARLSKAKKQLAAVAIDVAERMAAANEIELAAQAATIASAAAARSYDPVFSRQVRERCDALDWLNKQWTTATEAAERLKTDPDNPSDNLAWGRFVCFVQERWEEGLPYLAKSNHPTISRAAKLELAVPVVADDKAKVADAWWDVVTNLAVYEKSALQRHARMWYREVVATSTGLTKIRAQRQLTDIEALLAGTELPEDYEGDGLIGRGATSSSDVGLLFKYQPGRPTGDIPSLFSENQLTYTSALQFEFVGYLHVPKPTSVTITLATTTGTTSKLGGAEFFINDKLAGRTGSAQPTLKLEIKLAQGEHAIRWRIGGGFVSSAHLEFQDEKGGPIRTYYTEQLLEAGTSKPTATTATFNR